MSHVSADSLDYYDAIQAEAIIVSPAPNHSSLSSVTEDVPNGNGLHDSDDEAASGHIDQETRGGKLCREDSLILLTTFVRHYYRDG
jgi:hypothetical protein